MSNQQHSQYTALPLHLRAGGVGRLGAAFAPRMLHQHHLHGGGWQKHKPLKFVHPMEKFHYCAQAQAGRAISIASQHPGTTTANTAYQSTAKKTVKKVDEWFA